MREATTRYVILGALEMEGPLSGYEIRTWISQSVGYFWTESFGQLYPELKRLAAEKLISPLPEKQAHARARQRYEISPSGRRLLAAWVEQPARPQPVRAEFLLKLLFSRQSGLVVTRRHLEAIAEAERGKGAAFAGARAALLDEGPDSPDLVYALVVLRYGQHISAMRRAWVEESLQLLAAHEAGGPAAVLNAFHELVEEEPR
jgi:DNA-binding PadR family transcriptional regulator